MEHPRHSYEEQQARRRSAQITNSPVFHTNASDHIGIDPGKKWTRQHEEILKEWKAKCFVNLWLQDMSSYYYTKMYNWLSYPVIVISSVSSAALFASDNTAIKYVVGVMSLVSGILTSISRQMKPGELHQQHAISTRRYHNLIRHIDTCLSLTEGMRPHPTVFIEKIGVDIDGLMDSQLDPPLRIVQSFEKEYGPIDRMLYGEDIIELMKIEMHTSKMFHRIQKKGDISSSDSDKNSSNDISIPSPPSQSLEEPSFHRDRENIVINIQEENVDASESSHQRLQRVAHDLERKVSRR